MAEYPFFGLGGPEFKAFAEKYRKEHPDEFDANGEPLPQAGETDPNMPPPDRNPDRVQGNWDNTISPLNPDTPPDPGWASDWRGMWQRQDQQGDALSPAPGGGVPPNAKYFQPPPAPTLPPSDGSRFAVPGIGNQQQMAPEQEMQKRFMPQLQSPQSQIQLPPPPPSQGSPFAGRRIEANAGLIDPSILMGGGGQGLLAGGSGFDTLKSIFGGGEYRPLTGRGPRPPAAAPYQLDAMNPLSMMSGGGEPALSVGGQGGDAAPDPTLADSVAMQAPHNIRGDAVSAVLLGSGGADELGGGNMDMLGDGGPGGGGAPPADDGSNPGFFNKLFGGANHDRLGIGMSNIGAMLMASAGGDTAKGAAALQQGSQLLTNQRELEEQADYHKKALAAHAAQSERERYSLGYQPDGKGGWTFVKGGPADPEAAAALTSARAQAQYAGSVDPEDVKSIVDGWEDGSQPPDTTGLYKMGGRARAEAARRGFDYAGAKLQWEGAKRQIASLNGPQMTRFVGLAQSVNKTIDDVDALAKQVKNSGVIPLNKAKLDLFIKLKGNTPEGQLATQYRTAVNFLKEEFASLAKGGYAPDEASWELANQQINGDYGVDQLMASNKEVKRLINYRLHAIPGMNTLGPGAANRYTHNPGIPYEEEPPLTAPGEEPSTPMPEGFQGGQELWDEMTPEEREYW